MTLCSRPRGVNQLCRPDIAPQLLESIAFRHQRGDWWVHLALLMPDHLHMLVSFPSEKNLTKVVGEWKKFAARSFGVQWQRSFFEHRLRHDESLHEKEDYIRQNPVRAGLVSQAKDWRFVWEAAR